MRMQYSYGIVSFCPDLTSSSAESFPVGALLVGNLLDSDDGVAAVLVPALANAEVLDPMTREVLMSVSDLLRLHVDEVISEDRAAAPKTIVTRLHDKLRNSLFVSEISAETTTSVEAGADVVALLEAAFLSAVDADSRVDISAPTNKLPDLNFIHRFTRPSGQAARSLPA